MDQKNNLGNIIDRAIMMTTGAVIMLYLVCIAFAAITAAKFIADHNFDVAKYAGEIGYINDINKDAPYITDTEGESHLFYDLRGAHTFFPLDRHLPKEGSLMQVFEGKLYNNKTQKLFLLRFVW